MSNNIISNDCKIMVRGLEYKISQEVLDNIIKPGLVFRVDGILVRIVKMKSPYIYCERVETPGEN